MGLFDKLFGGKKQKTSNSSTNEELRTEFNIMTNISLEKCQKYENTKHYKLIESEIYQDLTDGDDAKYRMTISYELVNDNTNNQYPLEDVLDKYLMHVSDFLESENNKKTNIFKLEFGGYLDNMKQAQNIIGKRVFNSEYKSDDGQIRVNLIIE